MESGAPDRHETCTYEYFTGTRASTIKNGITKEPQTPAFLLQLLNKQSYSRYKLQNKAEAGWVAIAKPSLKPSITAIIPAWH